MGGERGGVTGGKKGRFMLGRDGRVMGVKRGGLSRVSARILRPLVNFAGDGYAG